MDEEEFIEATWGPEMYTPVAFHTLTVGPFKARTKRHKGETGEAAFERVYAILEAIGQKAFERQKGAYLNRVGVIAREARASARGSETKGGGDGKVQG